MAKVGKMEGNRNADRALADLSGVLYSIFDAEVVRVERLKKTSFFLFFAPSKGLSSGKQVRLDSTVNWYISKNLTMLEKQGQQSKTECVTEFDFQKARGHIFSANIDQKRLTPRGAAGSQKEKKTHMHWEKLCNKIPERWSWTPASLMVLMIEALPWH